jgi:hypothetical protein
MNIKDFKNPWAAENSIWFNEEMDKWSTISVQQQQLTSLKFGNLAEAAEYLGNQSIIMESYWNFQKGIYHWFFSPNSHLDGAYSKPSKFETWDDWDNLNSPRKKTIGNLAGYNADITNVPRTTEGLTKLKESYKKWNNNLYSIHWSSNYGGSWMCNVFVGDAIYLYLKKSITNTNKHYYDPQQIQNGQSSFKSIKVEKVKRGTIVLMLSGIHMEIITSLKDYWFADKGFCSIGAGRGLKSETGIIKCDSGITSDENRELNNPNNQYYSL